MLSPEQGIIPMGTPFQVITFCDSISPHFGEISSYCGSRKGSANLSNRKQKNEIKNVDIFNPSLFSNEKTIGFRCTLTYLKSPCTLAYKLSSIPPLFFTTYGMSAYFPFSLH